MNALKTNAAKSRITKTNIPLKINPKPTFKAEGLLRGMLTEPLQPPRELLQFKEITENLMRKEGSLEQVDLKARVLNMISSLWDALNLDKLLLEISNLIPLINWNDAEWVNSNCMDILLGHLLLSVSVQEFHAIECAVISQLSDSIPKGRKRKFYS